MITMPWPNPASSREERHRGSEGPRNAVATGLLLGYEEEVKGGG
jgi:hypothetical protein